MPINAHTHLELAGIPGPIREETPGPLSMPDWVTRLMAFRRGPDYAPAAAVEQALERLDAEMVGDIYQKDVPVAAYEKRPDIRKRLFYELIGWREDMVQPCIEGLEGFLDAFSPQNRDSAARDGASPSIFPGISPHAPQTVHRLLLEAAVETARQRDLPLALHLAESPEEMQLLTDHDGPLRDMMRRVDPSYEPEQVLAGRRPLDYLRLLASAPRVAIIHGNYLDAEEIAWLGRHADRFVVVYCPRTHGHFGHPEYPLRQMLRAGVRVALGTDSPASSPDLSIAAEIDFLRQRFPDISDSDLQDMTETNGRFALGF